MELHIFVLVQAVVVALPAAWLSLGALDNILHSAINRDDVARVLALEALREWPDVRARVGHRAITNERTVRLLFILVVIAECAASILLWIGAISLGLAFVGLADHGQARDLAMIGALGFTGIWASFLIGGQWFYYWYGEFGQSTHLKATLWGLATLIVLAL
ncbi:MAG: DUF2165 family protein [bacterium]|nr:DUF2165 family protein [bacterium]MDE0242067.1 DUF2165 family protein [bacterium]